MVAPPGVQPSAVRGHSRIQRVSRREHRKVPRFPSLFLGVWVVEWCWGVEGSDKSTPGTAFDKTHMTNSAFALVGHPLDGA